MTTQHLARWVPANGTRQTQISTIRELTDAELSAIRAAQLVVAVLNGPNLYGPIDASTNRLLIHNAEFCRLHEGELSVDLDALTVLGGSLDEWLVMLVLFRTRNEREIARALGAEAGRRAKAIFQTVYDSNGAFRLAWEWRNAAQHHINPLDVTYMSGAKIDGGWSETWRFDFDKVRAKLFKSQEGVPERVESVLASNLDCPVFFLAALAACESATRLLLIDNGDAIERAALRVFDLAAEAVAASDGDAALACVLDTSSIAPGSTNFTFQPIPIHTVAARRALGGLEVARQDIA